MRVLGVDYGDRRTGVAVSDPLGWTAQGLEVVNGGTDVSAERIAVLARQYSVRTIVVGYPINMDGTVGFRAERTDLFVANLEERLKGASGGDGADNVKIIKWDERLTSVEAAKILRTSGTRTTSRSVREAGKIDILSASILLQSYLDSIGGI